MFVHTSVVVMVTPGTAPPLRSGTFQSSVPTATCAVTWTGANRIPNTASTEATRSGKRLPVIALLLVGLIRRRAYAERLVKSRRATRRSGNNIGLCRTQYRSDRRRNPAQFLLLRTGGIQRFEAELQAGAVVVGG